MPNRNPQVKYTKVREVCVSCFEPVFSSWATAPLCKDIISLRALTLSHTPTILASFINNEFVDSLSKKTFAVINPCKAQKFCDVAEALKEDVDLAVKAAQAAFHPKALWRTMDPSARGQLMNKLADLIDRDADDIASLMVLENGKPFTNALEEVQYSAKTLRYFAGW